MEGRNEKQPRALTSRMLWVDVRAQRLYVARIAGFSARRFDGNRRGSPLKDRCFAKNVEKVEIWRKMGCGI